jgi:hypothetical protein
MRHDGERPSVRTKPLTEPVLLILTSLAGRPHHGYALMKDVETDPEQRPRSAQHGHSIRRSQQTSRGWMDRAF